MKSEWCLEWTNTLSWPFYNKGIFWMSRVFKTVMNKTLPSKSPAGELHSNKRPVRMRKMQVEVKYSLPSQTRRSFDWL